MSTQVIIVVKQFKINLQIKNKKKSGDQFSLCKQRQTENYKDSYRIHFHFEGPKNVS